MNGLIWWKAEIINRFRSGEQQNALKRLEQTLIQTLYTVWYDLVGLWRKVSCKDIIALNSKAFSLYNNSFFENGTLIADLDFEGLSTNFVIKSNFQKSLRIKTTLLYGRHCWIRIVLWWCSFSPNSVLFKFKNIITFFALYHALNLPQRIFRPEKNLKGPKFCVECGIRNNLHFWENVETLGFLFPFRLYFLFKMHCFGLER